MIDSDFIGEMKQILAARYRCGLSDARPQELHGALSQYLMDRISGRWGESEREYDGKKRVYYLSAEFLVGRAVYNNLLALGLTGEAERLLRENGASLASLEEIEDALDELPEEQREVFVGHEIAGRSFKEMSAESGVNVNTLLARKRYAVLHLRERLQNIYDELTNA